AGPLLSSRRRSRERRRLSRHAAHETAAGKDLRRREDRTVAEQLLSQRKFIGAERTGVAPGGAGPGDEIARLSRTRGSGPGGHSGKGDGRVCFTRQREEVVAYRFEDRWASRVRLVCGVRRDAARGNGTNQA